MRRQGWFAAGFRWIAEASGVVTAIAAVASGIGGDDGYSGSMQAVTCSDQNTIILLVAYTVELNQSGKIKAIHANDIIAPARNALDLYTILIKYPMNSG